MKPKGSPQASAGDVSAGGDADEVAKSPTLFEMLKTALYIGAIGYGGPAILALMKENHRP